MVAVGWMRRNLFPSPFNTVLTLLCVAFLAWTVPPMVRWLFIDAVWGRQPVEACEAVRGQGACWAVVWEKFRFMMFGTYPYEEQWRPAIVIVVLVSLLVISALRRFWNRRLIVIWTVGIAVSYWLMGGGLGLVPVRSGQWGGPVRDPLGRSATIRWSRMTHAHDHRETAASRSRGALLGALGLTGGFTLVEVAAGVWTGSLSLLADAAHMLTDVGGLGLALFATWIAARPPTPAKTYGLYRVEILAALVNGVVLLIVAAAILISMLAMTAIGGLAVGATVAA